MWCQICKVYIDKEEDVEEVYLDGTDDVYHLDVCVKCRELYSTEYFSPEEVDKIIKGELNHAIE